MLQGVVPPKVKIVISMGLLSIDIDFQKALLLSAYPGIICFERTLVIGAQ